MEAKYLEPTYFLNYNDAIVVAYANKLIPNRSKLTKKEIAVALYYSVRDDIYYNTYDVVLKPETFRASFVLETKVSFCIPKAVLYAALLRYFEIPSRLFFADVKNHLSTPKLLEQMRTDEFVYHGGVEAFINDKWLRSTPAFNKSLCEKLGVPPLDFDGEHDAIFQSCDLKQNKFMDYLRYHGSFSDLPFDDICHAFKKAYPHLYENQ